MRPHARAVFLLGGWLLMLPPMKPTDPYLGAVFDFSGHPTGEKEMVRGSTPDFFAPITIWTQVAAFDTAKECETARVKQRPKPLTNPKRQPGFSDELGSHFRSGEPLPPEVPDRTSPEIPFDALDPEAPLEKLAIRPGAEGYFARCVPAEAVYPSQLPAQK